MRRMNARPVDTPRYPGTKVVQNPGFRFAHPGYVRFSGSLTADSLTPVARTS
jgi:hypothetical protein